MEESKKSIVKRCMDKLFGGLRLSWPAVLLFAVGTAVLTAVFLTVPVFKDSSFERMGVTFEAWIFFAVIIMANCQKPLESALKTFVFFLVSQPLIYLLQVPFSVLGWQLFRFYRYWFIWTLLTFPMAFVGWYITRRKWLSVLILAPVLAFLGFTACESGAECLRHFPHLLVTALFCLMQIILYVTAFFPDWKQKTLGLLIASLAAALFLMRAPQVNLTTTKLLPGEPSFSEEATVSVEDSSLASAQLHSPEKGVVYLYAHQYGSTTLVVTDGGRESRYTLEVYRDEQGDSQVRITQQG